MRTGVRDVPHLVLADARAVVVDDDVVADRGEVLHGERAEIGERRVARVDRACRGRMTLHEIGELVDRHPRHQRRREDASRAVVEEIVLRVDGRAELIVDRRAHLQRVEHHDAARDAAEVPASLREVLLAQTPVVGARVGRFVEEPLAFR